MAKRFSSARMFSNHTFPVVLSGQVAVGADGSVTDGSAIRGMVVAKSTTGVYTLTLSDKFKTLLDADCKVLKATLANVMTQWKDEDVDGTRVITLHFYTVDRSPNVLIDPVSSSLLIRVELEASGVT